MAEVAPKVYDVIQPTPVSLKELSGIAVSLEIWRREVNEYRRSLKLETFDPNILRDTTIETMVPGLPSVIYKTIKRYFRKFRKSMVFWLEDHYERIFCFHYSHQNFVLEDFDDFVCDYDGSIHYVRTAERMVRCVRFNAEKKFIISCDYFFEDDIRRIWPSVCGKMNLKDIDFSKCPQLYYWICCLKTELDKIPISRGNNTIDEEMFDKCMFCNRTSLEYFWNRIPLENRMKKVIEFAHNNPESFVKFTLPQLNNQQTDEFVNKKDNDWIYNILRILDDDELLVLRTWLYIRNFIKESAFTNLVVRMLKIDCYDNVREVYYHDVHEEDCEFSGLEDSCHEIWNTAPYNLKQSVIRELLSDGTWPERMDLYGVFNDNFLLTILQNAPSNERRSFWHNSWRVLIIVTKPKAWQRIIELCFGNEHEMTRFKENVMVKSEDIYCVCLSYLLFADFNGLNEIVSFCCPELQTARNFKQRLMQSAFHDDGYRLRPEIVRGTKEFNEFINDAYDSVDLSTDFKNQLMSSSSVRNSLSDYAFLREVSLKKLIEFIDTFVSTEQTVLQIKTLIIDSLREYATSTNDRDIFRKSWFNSILCWCLGSNEKIEEFKLTCAS